MGGDAEESVKPRTWETKEELVTALRACKWERLFLKSRRANFTIHRVVTASVGGNTFRAFRSVSAAPSVVFREWAIAEFTGGGYLERLLCIDTPEAMGKLVMHKAAALRQRWLKCTRCNLAYGPSVKLQNLLLKSVSTSRYVPEADYKRIRELLHVPLDSYTLLAVRAIHNRTAAKRIPGNATMGFVADQRTYDAIQETIRSLAYAAKVPPIALDVLAWDQAHAHK